MWKLVANFILRNRFFVLGAMALLTVFFGYYALNELKLDNKYGTVLPKDSPATEQYRKFKDEFGEDGGILVIAIQPDSLYTEKNFLKWKQLGDSILRMNGVISVLSEATLFSVKKNHVDKRFEIHRIFSDISFKEKSIDQIKKEIKLNPIYDGLLYSQKNNVSLMMIRLDEKDLSDRVKSKVVLDIENLADNYNSDFGKLHYAGLPHLRVVISKRIQNEMYWFIGLSLFVTSALIFLFFRTYKAIFICNIVVFISVIWSLGSIAFVGYKLSILMALIPPLMIVIGVPNCIYLLTKFHQEVKIHGNKVKALSQVIQKIGTAMFLTNFTTAIGFITFAFTNSEKLTEFGIAASFNVMMTFVLSLCLLPIFESFSKPPKKHHLRHLDRNFSKWIINIVLTITQKYRIAVYVLLVLLTVFSVNGLRKITVTGNMTDDLPAKDPIVQDLKFIEKNFGGSIPFEIIINCSDKTLIDSLSTLSRIEKVQQYLAQDPDFSKSFSIVNYMKEINMIYHGNKPEYYRLMDEKEKNKMRNFISYFNMINGDEGGLSLKDLINTDEGTIRIRCQMKDLGSYEVSQKVDKIRPTIQNILDPTKKKMSLTFTGTSVIGSEGTKYLVINLISSIIYAILSIALLMLILFRSWQMVLISMIPNLFPLLFTAGIMGYFNIPLKPSTLLVYSIAFGITVDNTIHYLSKYRHELKHKEWDIKTCVLVAIKETGLGMFYTSVVLFCGFSVFSFSQFGGTQALGILISVTLFMGMLTNMIVLPTTLFTLGKIVNTKKFEEPYFEAFSEEDEENNE
jgi:predicted RND superfamily exporter protein